MVEAAIGMAAAEKTCCFFPLNPGGLGCHNIKYL